MKKIVLLIVVSVFFPLITYAQHEEIINNSLYLDSFVNSNYKEIRDVTFWNESMQSAFYYFFFRNNNIEAVFEFRNFIESLDRDIYQLLEGGVNNLSSDRPAIINPVIVLIDNYFYQTKPYKSLNLEYLSDIYNKRPDLFLEGDRSSHDGYFRDPPIIHAVTRGNTDIVKFIFENNIDWKRSRRSDRDSGSELGLGGNLLTYLSGWDGKRNALYKHLVENGIEEEIDISNHIIFIAPGLDSVNIWLEPDFNSEIIYRIDKNTKLKPIKMTAYKISNYQWVYFETEDGIKGWAPYRVSIDYDSGI
jgi:hypothetical protein